MYHMLRAGAQGKPGKPTNVACWGSAATVWFCLDLQLSKRVSLHQQIAIPIRWQGHMLELTSFLGNQMHTIENLRCFLVSHDTPFLITMLSLAMKMATGKCLHITSRGYVHENVVTHGASTHLPY